MDEQNVIRKIKYLLEKAGSAEKINSASEAASFYAKANELILKYKIKNERLAGQDSPENNAVINTGYRNGIAFRHKSAMVLVGLVVRHHFCEVIYESGHDGELTGRTTLIGRKSNIEIVKYIYDSVRNRFNYLANRDWRRYQLINTLKEAEKTREDFFHSWHNGAVEGLRILLEKNKKRLDSEYPGKLTALVKIETGGIDEYIKKHFKSLITIEDDQYNRINLAWAKGYHVGVNITLHPGIKRQEKHFQLNSK